CVCRPLLPVEKRTPLTFESASHAMDLIFSLVDFSPPSDKAKAVLTNGLMEMCETVEQSKFVIERLPQYHSKWTSCGLRGLRQILCQKYTPKDRVILNATKEYPDGLPQPQAVPLPPMKALPPRHTASANPSIEASVSDLADGMRMEGGLRSVPPIIRKVAEG